MFDMVNFHVDERDNRCEVTIGCDMTYELQHITPIVPSKRLPRFFFAFPRKLP